MLFRSSDGSEIGGSLVARLGAGENSLDHDGHIAGNLFVTSLNPEDRERVDYSDGTVDGRVWLRLSSPWWR